MSSAKITGKNGPARHLAGLFEEYDCVILPGIGGFLLHESTSALRREDQIAHPPARIVKFNALLKEDDGLLTHSIAREEAIPFSEAKKVVDLFIAEGLRTLQEWKTWELEGIGSFRLNHEEKVVFTPGKDFNCLPSSFGLRPVQARRIKNAESIKTTRGRRVDRKPAIARQNAPGTVKWTVILALPVIAFLLWGIISPESVRNYYSGYSFLVADILDISNPGETEDFIEEPLTSPIDEALAEPDPHAGYSSDMAAGVSRDESSPAANPAVLEAPAGDLATPVAPPNDPLRYYVIGGAFREGKNAEKFLNSLERKGFKPEIAGANGSGHLRISYASFDEKSEALEFLTSVRKTENPDAWLLRY